MTIFLTIPFWIVYQLLNLGISQATFVGIRWNKRLKNFEPIPGVLSHDNEKKKLVVRTRNEETYNFNEEPLHISYYEDPGFFHFYDNDTKISGICGDIWTSLSKLLNFTIVVTRWEKGSLGITFMNGTFTGILEDARLNKTDVIPKLQVYASRFDAVMYTPAFWTNGQTMFAFDRWKRDNAWMFKLFTGEVWCLIVISMIVLSLVSIITQKVLIRYGNRRLPLRSCLYHFFNTFATLCNQGDVIESNSCSYRILMFTIINFSSLILISYSSCLIYSVARETVDAPFSSLETLFEDTDVRIVVLNRSVSHVTFTNSYAEPIFKRFMNAKRVTVVSNLTELRHKVCLSSGRYALFSDFTSVLGMGTTICNLLPVGVTYYKRLTASGISRRVKNKKSLDIGIMKLREFGLIDALKKRYVDYKGRSNGVRRTDSLVIDIDHILLILTLFILGTVASIIFCLAENMFAVLTKRKTVKSVVQRYPIDIPNRLAYPRTNAILKRNLFL